MRGAAGKVACGALCGLLFHLMLGWAWSMVAAVGAGYWQGPRGWLTGALSLGMSFALLVGYNLAVAPAPVRRMGRVMGEIMGGLPGIAIFATTVLVGFLLGCAGGGLGSALRTRRAAP